LYFGLELKGFVLTNDANYSNLVLDIFVGANMSSPLIGNKILTVNPEAQTFHEAGLRSELNGNYAQAHASFDTAQLILAGLPQSLDVVVQSARITRDDGFTHVRNALTESNPSMLDQAQATISHSVETTAPLVSGTLFLHTEASSSITTPKNARREFLAEHGATVSLLGRIATVKEVMLGIDTRGDTETARHARNIEQQPYGLAHDILRKGNNGYYRVSNAMLGARQERLNGRLPDMVVWLGRATTGLAWTALRDPSNLKNSVRTFGSRISHLRSYQAAVKSVTTKP